MSVLPVSTAMPLKPAFTQDCHGPGTGDRLVGAQLLAGLGELDENRPSTGPGKLPCPVDEGICSLDCLDTENDTRSAPRPPDQHPPD